MDLSILNITPKFTTILVGNNDASLIYVRNKHKKAKELGIEGNIIHYQDIIEEDLIAVIDGLNQDRSVHGIFVQLPLPKEFNTNKILQSIAINKDVDGLHPNNLGLLAIEKNKGFLDFSSKGFVPCTPLGCMYILNSLKVNYSGLNAVVVGRSNLVGLPMSVLLLNNEATVTIVHSKTKNLADVCSKADIIVVAVGSANLIDRNYIKQGAIVIDVGISKVENASSKTGFSIKGDVNLPDVLPLVKHITPVPKGVGLLTIMCLMFNILKACRLNNNL